MSATIELREVSKRWKDFSINNISLSVNKGEYFVILGPTGAGKTLLLELIAGFHIVDEGKLFIDGVDMTYSPPEERNIGFIYQDYMLFPHLTVEENVAFGLKAKFGARHRCFWHSLCSSLSWRFRRSRRSWRSQRECESAWNAEVGEWNVERRRASEEEFMKEWMRERVREVLQMLGITHLANRFPETLSGGEKQKVAIARALAVEPKILLLDEPLSALDVPTREKLRADLMRLNEEEGITMVHVTHDRSEAAMLADRVAVMMRGEIVQVGTPQEIFSRPASAEIAEFVGVENILSGVVVRNEGGIAEIECFHARENESEVSCEEENMRIFAVSTLKEGTKVHVFIRPEDIILASARFHRSKTSAQNVIRSKIAAITRISPALYRVRMSNGLVAVVTAHAVENLKLRRGDEVHAIFKATSVHLLTAAAR